jgi:hypothetical protein
MNREAGNASSHPQDASQAIISGIKNMVQNGRRFFPGGAICRNRREMRCNQKMQCSA